MDAHFGAIRAIEQLSFNVVTLSPKAPTAAG
jgi:hypothetical protein